MKKLSALLPCLLIALAGSSQNNSIFCIKPGIEITVTKADHWRYVMPRQTALAIAENLERAKGCIIDYHLQQEMIDSLTAQVQLLGQSLNKVDEAKEQIEIIETIETKLNRLQKFNGWIKDRWKDLTAFLLGIIAAVEAGYIVYLTVTP
jgi:hypothetical protein